MSHARLLIIGNEVLSGEVADLNIQFLTRRLTGLGTRVRSVRVIPDEDPVIVAAIREAIDPASPLLVTGGIGPTHDDRTRGAVALATDRPLVRHPGAEAQLRAGYGLRLTEAELEMAMLPTGARLSFGPRSGVFGFVIDNIYVFPGVPDLLADVFESVAGEFAGRPDHRIEIMTPLKEGDFADALREVAAAFPDVPIGSYPTRGAGGWEVRLILRGPDPVRVEAAAARVREITR
ncbi:MAG: molybdopterin binding domain-containing protein [bacterium]|nr:MAG: molybdopterin binding domain-containing protein [bacterium]